MTRIDENREVQQIDAQRAQAEKPKGDAAKFNQAMQAKQSQGQQVVKQQPAMPKHTSANAMMGRSGIANPFASKLAQANKEFDIKQNKMAHSDKVSDLDSQRSQFQEDSDKSLTSRLDKQEKATTLYQEERTGSNTGAAISGQAGKAAQSKDMENGVQNQANAAIQGTGAQGTQATDGPAAAHTVEIPQQIIDKLVDKVSSGVTAEGLSTFQIELKDDVLKGANISITANGGKISVKVDTKDQNIRRLFQASEGQLARAFDHKGLSLDSLEISMRQ